MIALDTNILVYAHRRDSEWHRQASTLVTDLAEGTTPWAVAWPCIHEFLAIVTHARVFNPPTTIVKAIEQVEMWMESPSLRLIGELQGHWKELKRILTAGRVAGGAVHDARIAAICREHGVQELWSADRDFSRLPGVSVRYPLIA